MANKRNKPPTKVTNPFVGEVVTDPAEIEVSRPIHLPRLQILRQIAGPDSPRLFRCIFDRMVIGRSEDVEFSIDAADLSRRHAVLERVGDELRCTDLESRHGVLLNGVKVHSCMLRPGDTLQLGSVTFLFEEGEADPTR